METDDDVQEEDFDQAKTLKSAMKFLKEVSADLMRLDHAKKEVCAKIMWHTIVTIQFKQIYRRL